MATDRRLREQILGHGPATPRTGICDNAIRQASAAASIGFTARSSIPDEPLVSPMSTPYRSTVQTENATFGSNPRFGRLHSSCRNELNHLRRMLSVL
jgi:hypothetical protein